MNIMIQPSICNKDKYSLTHLLMDLNGLVSAVDAMKGFLVLAVVHSILEFIGCLSFPCPK
jgi:hypothetical protein